MRALHIDGIRVDDATMPEVLAWARQVLASRPACVAQIATLNPARFLLASEDASYRDVINGCALVTNDGIGISIAARLHGGRLRARVTGADLVHELAHIAAQTDSAVYLVGARPGVAARAATRLERRYPGCRVVGCHHGYFEDGSPEDAELVAAIRASGADIVIVGLGAPRDELWIARNRDALGAKLAIGSGAGIDFAAGEIRRAPRVIRRVGAEWIYRLAREPRRLGRRYLLGNPIFLWRVARTRARPAQPSASFGSGGMES